MRDRICSFWHGAHQSLLRCQCLPCHLYADLACSSLARSNKHGDMSRAVGDLPILWIAYAIAVEGVMIGREACSRSVARGNKYTNNICKEYYSKYNQW